MYFLKFLQILRVVLLRDTRSNDSPSNDARFMHKLSKYDYIIKRYREK